MVCNAKKWELPIPPNNLILKKDWIVTSVNPGVIFFDPSRNLVINRCEYSNFSPLDPFNIYAMAAVLLVDYVYSQRKPMGVSLVQFNSVNSRERRWSFFFQNLVCILWTQLCSKKTRISDCCACVVLCFVSPSLFSSIFKFMRISE